MFLQKGLQVDAHFALQTTLLLEHLQIVPNLRVELGKLVECVLLALSDSLDFIHCFDCFLEHIVQIVSVHLLVHLIHVLVHFLKVPETVVEPTLQSSQKGLREAFFGLVMDVQESKQQVSFVEGVDELVLAVLEELLNSLLHFVGLLDVEFLLVHSFLLDQVLVLGQERDVSEELFHVRVVLLLILQNLGVFRRTVDVKRVDVELQTIVGLASRVEDREEPGHRPHGDVDLGAYLIVVFIWKMESKD